MSRPLSCTTWLIYRFRNWNETLGCLLTLKDILVLVNLSSSGRQEDKVHRFIAFQENIVVIFNDSSRASLDNSL